MIKDDLIIDYSDPVLITGASGFIGARVVGELLTCGFQNLRCLVRSSSNLTGLNKIASAHGRAKIQVVQGNLLSLEDCEKIAGNVSVIYHLAAGTGEKSFPDAYLNSVVTTRNLLDATLGNKCFKRFVNVSSFSVYSNKKIKRRGLLDETCEIESDPKIRGDAYCYAKIGQDQLVIEYNKKYKIPFVIVRPGVVFGPGKKGIHNRVGIATFGIFLHLGGNNRIPLTYVDNCAGVIMLAGIKRGIEGEIFNSVDDDIPTSREFLKMYKKNVRKFGSLYVPYRIFYLFSYLWEKYSVWSEGQLPPVFNRRACETFWKGNRYSNMKSKELLGWKQKISTNEALKRYFEFQRKAEDVND